MGDVWENIIYLPFFVVYVKHSKEDGGNSSKINEKTKICKLYWSEKAFHNQTLEILIHCTCVNLISLGSNLINGIVGIIKIRCRMQKTHL